MIDKEKIHKGYPTHKHQADFWEHLGRTVATFGYLEDTLVKGIYVAVSRQPWITIFFGVTMVIAIVVFVLDINSSIPRN